MNAHEFTPVSTAVPVIATQQKIQRKQYLFPENSCDTHFHVFGRSDDFPLIAERAYTPAVASMDGYWKAFRPLGVDRCVLVQPSVYGRDHGLLKQTLRHAESGRMRGVAVIYEDTPDAEIEALHALGVRGARCNALFSGGVSVSSLQAVADRIRGLAWHVQLLVNVDEDPGPGAARGRHGRGRGGGSLRPPVAPAGRRRAGQPQSAGADEGRPGLG